MSSETNAERRHVEPRPTRWVIRSVKGMYVHSEACWVYYPVSSIPYASRADAERGADEYVADGYRSIRIVAVPADDTCPS